MQMQMEQLQAQLNEIKAKTEQADQDAIKKAAEVAKMIAETPAIAPILERTLGMNTYQQQVQPSQENTQTLGGF